MKIKPILFKNGLIKLENQMKIVLPMLMASYTVLMGCQGLQQVNSALGSVNNVLGVISGTATGSSRSGEGSVYVTPEAKTSVKTALNKSRARNDARRLFNEAKPSIENILGLIACGARGSQIGAYTDPDAFTNSFVTPFLTMDYHKSGCLDILRVNNIQKKAANAVKFSVDYRSPQSQETARRKYTAIKQPDGEWLFNWLL